MLGKYCAQHMSGLSLPPNLDKLIFNIDTQGVTMLADRSVEGLGVVTRVLHLQG